MCIYIFVWQDDFLLRHYDKGPCKNKLGHSRASVIWHRTQVTYLGTYCHNWDRIKGNGSHVKAFQFKNNLKMLHFDENPIRIGYLVIELWVCYQHWKQYKTKEFDLFLCQNLKNNLCDIRLILLVHVICRWLPSF